MPKLHIVIASTRPGRKGPSVASWINQLATTDGRFDVELVDLASFGLPVFDEPEHPASGKYVNEHTKRWSASVSAADAFVFVVPEYDHHPPSALVNAMQYLYREWNYKPLAFVSYGGQAGGSRAVEATKLLSTNLKMVPISEAVMLPFFDTQIDASGVFIADEKIDKAATTMLAELRRWTDALKVMRSA